MGTRGATDSLEGPTERNWDAWVLPRVAGCAVFVGTGKTKLRYGHAVCFLFFDIGRKNLWTKEDFCLESCSIAKPRPRRNPLSMDTMAMNLAWGDTGILACLLPVFVKVYAVVVVDVCDISPYNTVVACRVETPLFP